MHPLLIAMRVPVVLVQLPLAATGLVRSWRPRRPHLHHDQRSEHAIAGHVCCMAFSSSRADDPVVGRKVRCGGHYQRPGCALNGRSAMTGDGGFRGVRNKGETVARGTGTRLGKVELRSVGKTELKNKLNFLRSVFTPQKVELILSSVLRLPGPEATRRAANMASTGPLRPAATRTAATTARPRGRRSHYMTQLDSLA